MRSSGICQLLIIVLCGFSSVSAFGDSLKAYFAPNEVVIKVQTDVTIETVDQSVRTNQPQLQRVFDDINVLSFYDMFPFDRTGTRLSRTYVLYLDEQTDVVKAVARLQALECVTLAHPNYVYTTFATPTDSSFADQWGLMKINAPAAWDYFTGSDNVVIAVIDTGVDWKHQDLAGNIWMNINEMKNGLDDDGNGYIDDIRGWNFVRREVVQLVLIDDEVIRIIIRELPNNDPGDTTDDHGTHVAGIIGAMANNHVPGPENTVGTMWNCKLMALRVLNNAGYGNWADTIQGIRYAADNGAHVINMSLGGVIGFGIVDNAVQYAHSKGVVIVAAAGNYGDPIWEQIGIYGDTKNYPAAYDNVISVAATNQNDIKAGFSTYGEWVDISAPGVDILSTVLDNEYSRESGTSMAAPFVAGAAGMIIGYGQGMGKQFTPGQVAWILKESADYIDDLNPDYAGKLGAGRLNLAEAMALVQYAPSMITKIMIEPADQPGALTAQVGEHASINFRAIGVYSDNTTADITNQLTWMTRPNRYGRFSTITPGQFNAYQVPANREIVVIATLNQHETFITSDFILTVVKDPNASPVGIAGPDQVDPLSIASFTATILDDEGISMDITGDCLWEVVEGTSYAYSDIAQPGRFVILKDAANRQITIQASYIDPDRRQRYAQTKQVLVRPGEIQVAGLYLTAPGQIAAGSTLELSAQLFYADNHQTEDVTALAQWSVAPSSAGFFSEPGSFTAEGVAAETSVTLKAEYVHNTQVYTSQVTVTIIPAVPQGVTVAHSDVEENLNSLLWPCALPGLIVLSAFFLATFALMRED